MRNFIPLFCTFSFLLAACTTPPLTTPAIQTVPSLTATSTPTLMAPTMTADSLPTAIPSIDHVTVFMAEQAFFEKLANARGYHGVYVHEIGSPDTATFNPDVPFHGASTIKLAVAVVTMKVAVEKSWDIYSFVPPGQSATVADLIQQMIVDHSDYATNFLIDYVNSLGYHFDDELAMVGITGINVGQRLTTARGLGLLLDYLYDGSLGIPNSWIITRMMSYSAIDTETFPWAINYSLPGAYDNIVGAIYDQNVTVPFYGNIKYVANDAGFWTIPSGHTFVVVFLGNYGTEADFVLNQNTIHDEVAILTRYFLK